LIADFQLPIDDLLLAEFKLAIGNRKLNMSELSELYQQVILDHNKKPRNFRKLEGANHSAEGFNPLCGDQLTVYLNLEDDAVKEISFEGSGCAISKAAASMMTQAIKGKTKQEAEQLFSEFHRMVTGKRARQSENVLGRARIPSARQMRLTPLAHNARGAE
jgi:nitrogen fixation NifU-like protein